MADFTHYWRPADRLRVTALAIVWREGRILVSRVTRDDGTCIGWRPLGGGLEFTETAAQAASRELREEIGAEFVPQTRRAVLENIYQHHGHQGHEVIFVIEGRLEAEGLASQEQFAFEDQGFRDFAAWIALADFESGKEVLLPKGLLDVLTTPAVGEPITL